MVVVNHPKNKMCKTKMMKKRAMRKKMMKKKERGMMRTMMKRRMMRKEKRTMRISPQKQMKMPQIRNRNKSGSKNVGKDLRIPVNGGKISGNTHCFYPSSKLSNPNSLIRKRHFSTTS
jgi:hypothetical protein